MTNVAAAVLEPWPAKKYVELADEFAQAAVQMRIEAQHLLEKADQYDAASQQLRQAAPVRKPRKVASRNGRVLINLTPQIRDFARQRGDWFQMRHLQEAVPGSRQKLVKGVNQLIEKGTLEAEGYKRQRKYRFVRPEGNPGPFVAPRGEPSITQIRSKTTGAPVPHTKAQRPSGKPGADRKKAARGVRIRKRKAKGHS